MIKNFLVSILILILLGTSVFVGLRTHKSKEKTFTYNGVTRKYRIHLPKDYQEGRTYPVVFALHGLSFGSRVMEINTGLSRLADKEGFIVVYPYGSQPNSFIPYSWNSEYCCAYAYKENIDDVGFIASLISDLRNNYNIEDDKVYMTGHSNGGMLGMYVALKHPDKVRAVAVVSSAVGGKVYKEDEMHTLEKSYQAMPILLMNGRNDLAVPFDGSAIEGLDLYSFTSAYDAVDFWLDNNKCNKHPTEISNQDKFTQEVYAECEASSEVVFIAHNGSHTWPGSLKDILKSISGKNINATQLVWDFFKEH